MAKGNCRASQSTKAPIENVRPHEQSRHSRIYGAEMTKTGEKQKTRQDGQEANEAESQKPKKTGKPPSN